VFFSRVCDFGFVPDVIMDGHMHRHTVGRILRENRENRDSRAILELAPNIGGAIITEGEPNIAGFEDLSIEDTGVEDAGIDMADRDRIENGGVENAGIEDGANEAWTMVAAAEPIRAAAENADSENAGMDREGMGAGDILNLMRERVGDARAEEMMTAAGSNREEIENGQGDMGRRRQLIEMNSRVLNAGLAGIAARERFGIPGIERSRQAFNAAIAMVRGRIAEQRWLRERAMSIRENRERLALHENSHWERSEREAIERERNFFNEGRAMVRERERFLGETERLLAEERRLVNERDRLLIIRDRERLLREMEISLRRRETLMERFSLPHTEILSELLEERMQFQQRCYRRR
jgi:hypothetical protein